MSSSETAKPTTRRGSLIVEHGGPSNGLSELEVTALRWSARCNDEFNIGFLGPTVKRHGPLPEMGSITRLGLVVCEEDAKATGRRDPEKCGYWITDLGRSALAGAQLTAPESPVRPAQRSAPKPSEQQP